MSLDLYRRHSPDCRFVDKGQNYTKCTCPIWTYGTILGRPVRKTLRTRDWTLALRKVEQMETEGSADAGAVAEVITIRRAVQEYLADCNARKLAPSTIKSYTNVLNAFAEFADNRNLRDISGLRVEDFRHFRAGRSVSNKTQRKEIEHLRAFCGFCVEADWIVSNFARKIKPPEDDGPITMPYEKHEIDALIAACEKIENAYTASAERARKRARALILLLLYSGLRVSDAVRLERDRLKEDGRLLMYAMKTGVALYMQLHPDCVQALRDLPVESPYFLWSGKSKVSTATGSARRTVACLSKIAGVEARPHRFRDTFSVNLLTLGEDIRTVQLLLGHATIKTTEKHYAPFVKSFQKRLDDATAKLDFRPDAEPAKPRSRQSS